MGDNFRKSTADCVPAVDNSFRFSGVVMEIVAGISFVLEFLVVNSTSFRGIA